MLRFNTNPMKRNLTFMATVPPRSIQEEFFVLNRPELVGLLTALAAELDYNITKNGETK